MHGRSTPRSLVNLKRRYLVVSLAQTPRRSLSPTLSCAFKTCCAKTLHQTDLNCFKNSSRLLPTPRISLFSFPMWTSMRTNILIHLDSSDFWTMVTHDAFLTLRSATCLSATETIDCSEEHRSIIVATSFWNGFQDQRQNSS